MDTQRYTVRPSGAKLVVLENGGVRVCELDGRSSWMVGRYAPGTVNIPDIVCTSGIVSREHGWLKNIDGQWYYVDNPKNLNGTFHNGVKIPRSYWGETNSVPLKSGDMLRIDNGDLDYACAQGVCMLFTTDWTDGHWTAYPLDGRDVTIGRGKDCQIVVPLPYVSAHHARIFCRFGRYYITDCGSTDGTYLNGRQILGTQQLREKDVISICDTSYILTGNRLLYQARKAKEDYRISERIDTSSRPVVLRANIDTKRVKNNTGSGEKELIRDIRLEIREGTLVALLGTAGAGKSTVMNCLNGMDTKGVQGTVYYKDVDLMKNFVRMKHLIGSVPQEKIFHKDFTPEQEFRDAAIKRLPGDTAAWEIEERVNRTLDMLSMNGVRNNKNSKLSGGEQTRVNVGIELVADRELLCLDEPDQGLSPNYKHELFIILKNLAHKSGKTVLAIIHDVSEIDVFDQVIMLAKKDGVGRLAFSGSPEEARAFFGCQINEAYAILEENPGKFIR